MDGERQSEHLSHEALGAEHATPGAHVRVERINRRAHQSKSQAASRNDEKSHAKQAQLEPHIATTRDENSDQRGAGQGAGPAGAQGGVNRPRDAQQGPRDNGQDQRIQCDLFWVGTPTPHQEHRTENVQADPYRDGQ